MGAKFSKTSLAEIKEASKIRQAILDRVAHVTRKGNGVENSGVLRVELDIPHVNPLSWLRSSQAEIKTYWRSRDSHLVLAGIGEALLVQGNPESPFGAVRRLEERILPASSPGVRAFGGVRFDPTASVSEEWIPFGVSTFVIPRFQLEQDRGRTKFVCNIVQRPDANVLDRLTMQINQLLFPVRTHWSMLRPPYARVNSVDEMEWHEAIRSLLMAIENGVTEKVVLARKAVFSFLDKLDPFRVLAGLEAVAKNSFRFLYQLNHQAVFLGASPEKLFSRSGHRLVSEAVAGTGQRGKTAFSDRENASLLLSSEKDHREHAFVRDCIREVLEPLARRIRVQKKPSLLELNAGRHLRTRLEASLKEGVQTVELLEKMHPTPAVAGVPLASAMDLIEKMELFDRGWYAGPIGWVGRDDAEFAVAIRSGVVTEKELTLYSGAGIVQGSQSDLEWEEIEQKLNNFLRILQLDDTYANYQSRMG